MCNVHNAIFRGYNSIYLQAPHVRESDKTAFLGYCRTWCKFVMTHAAEEESGLFPEAEKLLDENVFEHSHEEHGESPLCRVAFL
jgi:hemerythrin superfamily protein